MTKVVLRTSHFASHHWSMKKLGISIVTALLVVGLATPASATEVRGGESELPWFCYMGRPIMGICPAEMLH